MAWRAPGVRAGCLVASVSRKPTPERSRQSERCAPAVESLEADRAEIPQQRDDVIDAVLARTYKVPRAREFAAHGVSRRLKTMTHCIECVFVILPPDREDHPSMDELTDAVVYIQAFIFNAFACIDNLAWIWVCEKKLTTEKGEPIPAGKVGLGKKCKLVRRTLPAEFRKYLKSLDAWFDHLENFRHALAHRIPLYIPPCVVVEKDYPAYQLLEAQKAKALRRGNQRKYAQFDAKQKALTRYQPEMTLSGACCAAICSPAGARRHRPFENNQPKSNTILARYASATVKRNLRCSQVHPLLLGTPKTRRTAPDPQTASRATNVLQEQPRGLGRLLVRFAPETGQIADIAARPFR
jgi:hypothetical protein